MTLFSIFNRNYVNLLLFIFSGGALLDASAHIFCYLGELLLAVCQVCYTCCCLLTKILLLIWNILVDVSTIVYTAFSYVAFLIADFLQWSAMSLISKCQRFLVTEQWYAKANEVSNTTMNNVVQSSATIAAYLQIGLLYGYSFVMDATGTIVKNSSDFIIALKNDLKTLCFDSYNYSIGAVMSVADYLSFVYTHTIDTLSLEIYLFLLISFLILLLIIFLVEYMQSRCMTFPQVQRDYSRAPILEFSDDSISDADDNGLDISDAEDETIEISDGSDNESTSSSMDSRYSGYLYSDGSSDSEGDIDEYEIATDTDSDGSISEPGEIEVSLPSRDNTHYSLRQRHSVTPARSGMSAHDLARRLESERDKHKCVVCQDNPKNVLVMPCKHMCLCIDCARSIVNNRNQQRRVCPLCRSKITKVMDVFI